MGDCVFCKIISGEIPGDIVYEDEQIIAFHDIRPLAPVHVLVVPKAHLASLDDLPDGADVTGKLLPAIRSVAGKLGVAGGYKVITNCGEPAGQVVPHLHFHILAGKKFIP